MDQLFLLRLRPQYVLEGPLTEEINMPGLHPLIPRFVFFAPLSCQSHDIQSSCLSR